MTRSDLSVALGVPGDLDPATGAITFGCPVAESLSRTINDLNMRGVLDPVPSSPATRQSVVTRIYRQINDDVVRRSSSRGAELKFDVTVLLPAHSVFSESWTGEYPKTIGHYHLAVGCDGIPSPDFYQVAHGTGVILLQRESSQAIECFACRVAPESTVLIPPGLAHLTVNTGDDPLVFSNICVRTPHLDYEPIERRRGAAYRVNRTRTGDTEVVLNTEYSDGPTVSPLREVAADQAALLEAGVGTGPIYELLVTGSRVLDLLASPASFDWTGTSFLQRSAHH